MGLLLLDLRTLHFLLKFIRFLMSLAYAVSFLKSFVCHSRVGLRGSLEIQKEEDLLNTEQFMNGVKKIKCRVFVLCI